MEEELYQLLYSLKLGDGCFITQRKTANKTYRVQTSSIKFDYLKYKENILNKYGIETKDVKCTSGYKVESKIYGFTTHVNRQVTEVGRMSKLEIINKLDINGLICYYLDDGSLHKTKHTMHLYTCSFTDLEVDYLIEKIYELFPIKKCNKRYERKKDGRIFPLIYIPVAVAKEFNNYVRDFLLHNNINSMLYKTFLPSQTIESIE